jgi:very-short-patch-repair endonuclease
MFSRMPDAFARELRTNMTDAEKRLWWLVRNRQLDGHKFRRQHPIGIFVADFVGIERRLIIELDGGQHADSADDARRTAWLEDHGWRVIRFWNNDVLTGTEGVLEVILQALRSSSSVAR